MQLAGSLCKRHAVTAIRGSDRLQATGFRICFTPLPGVLFTFPSRYWFAIGLPEVFSLAGRSPRIRTGFLVSRPTRVFRINKGMYTCTGLSPSPAELSFSFHLCAFINRAKSLYPVSAKTDTVWALSPFARRYWGNRFFFLLLPVLRCFSSRGLLHLAVVTPSSGAGLPHSDTCGSTRACQSPQIFAACRVLLRLRKPGHPPAALIHFLLFSL